jgi:hypothetical protein
MLSQSYDLYAKQKIDGKTLDVLDDKGERILVHRLTIRDASLEAVINPALRILKVKAVESIPASEVSKLGREQAFYALQKWEERSDDGEMREVPKTEWPVRFKLNDALVGFINRKSRDLAKDEGVVFEDEEGN